MRRCNYVEWREKSCHSFFAFFLAGWLAWVYTALRVVALSGLHRAVKACYAVDMAADDQIKDCCRACVLCGSQNGGRCARYKAALLVGACFKA